MSNSDEPAYSISETARLEMLMCREDRQLHIVDKPCFALFVEKNETKEMLNNEEWTE